MREDLVRKFAAELGVANFRPKTGRGWLETSCVLAPWTHPKGADHSPSFAIHVNETGKSFYACQGCKHKGTFAGLAYKLYGFTKDDRYKRIAEEIEQVETHTLSDNLPEFDDEYEDSRETDIERTYLSIRKTYEQYPSAFFNRDARNYIISRDLKPFTAWSLGLRFDWMHDRVLFPVFDKNQHLRGLVGRAIYEDADMKVKEYLGLNKIELFLGEHRVFRNRKKFKFVIIVEGPFDYAKVYQAGFPNVMALLGSELTKPKFEKLVDLDLPIIWMVDNDAGGEACLLGKLEADKVTRREKTSALSMLSPFLPQLTVTYPKKGGTDPGSLSESRIRRMIESAELYI